MYSFFYNSSLCVYQGEENRNYIIFSFRMKHSQWDHPLVKASLFTSMGSHSSGLPETVNMVEEIEFRDPFY